MAKCKLCEDDFSDARAAIGYDVCLVCGEAESKKVVRTVVPLAKSSYQLVTDLSILKQLNKYSNEN